MEIKKQSVLVMDFGGQYTQLIARRVRECNVYCEIKSYKTTAQEIKDGKYMGVIFTGGPNSAYDANGPKCDPEIFSLGIPVLGICYGAQLMAETLGGKVESISDNREYGKTKIEVNPSSLLFHRAKPEIHTGDDPLIGMARSASLRSGQTTFVLELPDGRQLRCDSLCRLGSCFIQLLLIGIIEQSSIVLQNIRAMRPCNNLYIEGQPTQGPPQVFI